MELFLILGFIKLLLSSNFNFSIHRDNNESSTNRKLKQINLALKHKKFELGKMLSMSIVPTNIHSLKFPIAQINEKIETNPLEIIKANTAQQKNSKQFKKLKLFKKRK
jgi:hypothetical protein